MNWRLWGHKRKRGRLQMSWADELVKLAGTRTIQMIVEQIEKNIKDKGEHMS